MASKFIYILSNDFPVVKQHIGVADLGCWLRSGEKDIHTLGIHVASGRRYVPPDVWRFLSSLEIDEYISNSAEIGELCSIIKNHTVTIRSLLIYQHFAPFDPDNIDAIAVWKCTTRILLLLSPQMDLGKLVIRNPFPLTLVRRQLAYRQTTEKLQRMLTTVDRHIGQLVDERLPSSTLKILILEATEETPYVADEVPRIARMFPALHGDGKLAVSLNAPSNLKLKIEYPQ